MGFGSKSRKQAQQRQQQAYNSQQQAIQQAQAQRDAYNADFDNRNADIIGIGQRSSRRLRDLERGVDIGSVYSTLSNTLNQGANAVKNTMNFTGGLGTNAFAQQDPRYQQKLRSVAERDISKGLGQALAQGALGERDRDTGLVLDTNQYLSNDKKYGLGLTGQTVGDFSNLFGNSTTIRQQEMQRAQQAWGTFGNILSIGTGLATGFGGLASTFGLFGSGSSATGGYNPSGGAPVR